MDKLKFSQWGERLKTGGAQMSRLVSDKMKEMLQTPTPESKMVDEATSEMMEEPNWGMNLRICAMINSEEFNGTEIVRAIKKKIGCNKNSVSQRLSLDLLETCSMNCEKVFSEIASEKVLDEMVKMIENPQADVSNRDRAFQLIRAWGQSEDLDYLPVFQQTYISLQGRTAPPAAENGDSAPMNYSLESYIQQQPLSPSERYPGSETGFGGANNSTFQYNSGNLSVEQKNECLATARNSLELLSSILNAETEPKPIKEDLTVSLLENCKQSQPVVQRIIESTTDDEAMLFEALNLHEELQQVINRCKELETGPVHGEQAPEAEGSDSSAKTDSSVPVEHNKEVKVTTNPPEGESTKESSSKEEGTNNLSSDKGNAE